MNSNLPPLVCVETAKICIEGIFNCRGQTRLGPTYDGSSHVISRDGSETVRTSDNRTLVMVAYFSKKELTIPTVTVLDGAEEFTEELIIKINAKDKP